MAAAFTAPVNLKGSSLTSNTLPAVCSRPAPLTLTPRAQADLPPPGIPSGQDPLDNAPLRHYVPRPVETYEDRGFATILPRTWEGETNTIGAGDIEPVTKEEVEESRKVPVDAASTGAFVEYARMMKEERAQALADQARRNSAPTSGRPTCGETEGTEFVSNARPILVDGVKVVEYWGVPNGPVPRLFGGPGE
uniref:LRC4 n=1 Tax=Griffithsia pacifica TaxID=35689 RepID=A0A291FEB1_GRIPA|nr:LRC4 [Griffithsia pacifica]5Y6P_C1 Chain C1, LRC4 [Griffithsia pacifica]5Y6P_D1 Chain D1, LRC4 [Griffithsia pacifica]